MNLGLLSSTLALFLRPLIHHLDKAALPKYDGHIALSGLRARVEARFQDFAIPHVLAENEHDLFFAQGFLHAQERLWQMESMRRFLAGRLAEIIPLQSPPSDLVQNDYFMRVIGVPQAAADSARVLDEQIHAHLEAYANGVNRYIERCGKKLPWEFRLLRYEPEPWRPLDSLTIGKGLALLLSTALYTRLNLIALTHRLGHEPAKLRALWPADSLEDARITKTVWQAAEGLWRFANGSWSETAWHSTGHGSNNWALAGAHATSGHALLCNDPHLRFGLPAMFYLMRLRALAPEYDVCGASIPGLPYIQLGHNRDIAWGVTAALCDDVELYREQVHRVDGSLYRGADDWRPFAQRQELIGVRGQEPVKRIVRSTRHGPVVSDFVEVGNAGEVLALRWTAHAPSHEFRAAYGINRARCWSEFLGALAHHSAPCVNYVYADRSNNIGYAFAGSVPLREAPHTQLPVEGWIGANDWRGAIPFDELPRLYNPAEGMVASANNRIADRGYPHLLAQFPEPSYRIRRIEQLLRADEKLSMRDMAAIQMDTLSLHAQALVQTLRSDLQAVADAQPALTGFVEQLLAWDGNCRIDSTAAAIFHVWHQRLMANLLLPTLGEELFSGYISILNRCIEPVEQILADADSPWFAARSRAQVVALSLGETAEELRRRLSGNSARWRWGRLHRLTLQHALGRNRLLARCVNLGPFASAGDGMTINAGNFQHSKPYDHFIGAALRMIVDTGQWNDSGFVLPGGQSGHPASPHYGDQLALWRQGQMVKLPFDEIRSDHCLILSPC